MLSNDMIARLIEAYQPFHGKLITLNSFSLKEAVIHLDLN